MFSIDLYKDEDHFEI